jgi:hypothetical protein
MQGSLIIPSPAHDSEVTIIQFKVSFVTSWRVLLEKLLDTQLVKKFLAFYGT